MNEYTYNKKINIDGVSYDVQVTKCEPMLIKAYSRVRTTNTKLINNNYVVRFYGTGKQINNLLFEARVNCESCDDELIRVVKVAANELKNYLRYKDLYLKRVHMFDDWDGNCDV